MFLPLVSACSTVPAPCLPASEAMEKAGSLPPIVPDLPNGQVSERKLYAQDNDDVAAYNTLAVKHNALVDHVKKFCQ
jgi:hypothetical protein